LTTKVDKFKLFILILRKKVQQHALLLLIIYVVRLLNGRFGIVMLSNLKESKRKMKNKRIKSIITKSLLIKNQKEVDTLFLSKDA
jgi:hypothetical protein